MKPLDKDIDDWIEQTRVLAVLRKLTNPIVVPDEFYHRLRGDAEGVLFRAYDVVPESHTPIGRRPGDESKRIAQYR